MFMCFYFFDGSSKTLNREETLHGLKIKVAAESSLYRIGRPGSACSNPLLLKTHLIKMDELTVY